MELWVRSYASDDQHLLWKPALPASRTFSSYLECRPRDGLPHEEYHGHMLMAGSFLKGLFLTLTAFMLLCWADRRLFAAGPDSADNLAAEREDDELPAPVARIGGHNGWGVCSFSRDGRKILTAGDKKAWLWDGTTYQQLLGPLTHDDTVYAARFSRDGSKVVTASADGAARVWEAKNGKLLRTLRHTNASLHQAAFSPDTSSVITTASGNEREAKIWNVASGTVALGLRHENGVESAEFSPDGARIVTATSTAVSLWDARTGKLLKALSLGDNDFPGPAAFSPDGTKVATGNDINFDRIACVWDAKTGELLAKTGGHWGRVTSIAFSPDGRKFVTTTDGSSRVWDTATGKPVTPKMGDGISMMHAACFSPDGTLIVAVGEGTQAAVWDASTGKMVMDLSACQNYTDACFSPDGTRVLTVCSDEGVTLVWKLKPRALAAGK
jgi:WD40 repeat protein